MNTNTVNTLLGSKVQVHRYYLDAGNQNSEPDNRYSVDEYSVLLENDNHVVLSDESFTTVKKTSEYNDTILDIPYVVLNIDSEFFGDGIMFKLYSTKKLPSDAIKEIIIGTTKKKLKGIGLMDMTELKDKIDEVIK